MKLFETRRRKKPRIEIIPMIDVMLLLLVYYVLSTVAMGHLEGIPVDLPKASTGETQKRADVTITITKAGDFFFNKEPLDASHLASELERAAGEVPGGVDAVRNGNVTISADMEVQHGLVVRAMNDLRRLGVTHFGIATDPGETP